MFKGEQFIHEHNPTLHTTPPVEQTQTEQKRAGENISQKPAKKLADWLSVLEKTHLSHNDDLQVMERLKKYYHKTHITISLDDIPQIYWNNNAVRMVKQGYGGDMRNQGIIEEKQIDKDNKEYINYTFPQEMQKQELEIIKANQKSSLDKWLNYLSSEDAMYPIWAKYWVFTSILTLGKFKKEFDKEDKEDKEAKEDEDKEAKEDEDKEAKEDE